MESDGETGRNDDGDIGGNEGGETGANEGGETVGNEGGETGQNDVSASDGEAEESESDYGNDPQYAIFNTLAGL